MLQEIDWPDNRDYRSGTEREPMEFYLTALENSNHLDLLLGLFQFFQPLMYCLLALPDS